MTTEGETRPSALDSRAWLLAASLTAVTGLIVFATLSLTREFGRVSPVWLANAPALVVLLRTPMRQWPLMLTGSIGANAAANLESGDFIGVAFGLALLNGMEVALCAMALRRWCGPLLDLSSGRHLMIFLGVAGIATPTVTALPAAMTLHALGIADFGPSFVLWAAADSLGLLILAPVLLTGLGIKEQLAQRPFSRRAVIALLVLVAVTIGVFGQSRYPLLFLVPPALLLITVEMERLGAAIGIVLIAAIAIALSLAGSGPLNLASPDPEAQVVVLQVFLALCTGVALATAVLLTQWRRLRRSLQTAYEEAQIQSRRTALAEQVASVGHWRMELADGQINWSTSLYDVFGLEDHGGFTLARSQELVHPEDRPNTLRRLEAVKSGQTVPDTVMRMIRPNGEVRHVLARMVCEKGPDGTPQAVIGTLVDVTVQKEAELLISRSEERYRRLAENVSDVIATYKVDGTIVYISPSVHGLLGYRPDELIGVLASRLMHPDDVQAARDVVRAYLEVAGQGEAGPRVEYRALHKDGHVVWIEAHMQAIIAPDGTVELQDALRDITGRKAVAAELEAARRAAEDAARVKSEFLANMSHELRTPLTSILGFTRLAAHEPTLVGASRVYVERVAEASQALLTTVNDILDFSQVEAGALVIRPEPFSPFQVSHGTLDLFQPQADAKGLRLALDFEMDEAAVVLADPARVRQVLLNLLGNAVKFTTTGSVGVAVSHDGSDLRVVVTDTGEGMSAEACQRLFLRFSQVDGSSTRNHGGTGLGLAICKGLVEAMGGRIGVESAPGHGSRFWFHVPAPLADNLAVVPAGDQEADDRMDRSARILVVDDNPANRELGRLFLAAIGADVTEAASGDEALRLTAEQAFDLILMDIRMPGMDGWQTAAAIRARGGASARTPILAFTANAPDHSEEYFRRGGFQGVVAKPLDAAALLNTVLEALAAAEANAPDPMLEIATGS